MKTVLVTGGAGYIGSLANKLLHRAGFSTLVLDDLSAGDRRAVVRGTLIEGDFGDEALLSALFSKNSIDAVMHFAGSLDVGESVREPAKYYTNNVSKTLVLLKTLLKHGKCPFIFSSSAAVYGHSSTSLIEESPCFPVNPYGHSKLIIERVLQDFDQAYGLRSCSLRYFNAAGGDPDREIKQYNAKDPHLIPVALRSVRTGEPLTIFGDDYPTLDGTCVRDYIHVHDIAKAHVLALENLLNGGKTDCFNLGNGLGFSIRQVLDAVEKVTQKPLRTVLGKRREGDPPSLIANAEKANAHLNWKPKYLALESMIEHVNLNLA